MKGENKLRFAIHCPELIKTLEVTGGMEQVTDYIEQMQDWAQTIGYSLAGLCVVILAIMLIAGGTQGISKAKSWAIGILAGIALLSFGVALVTTLQG